MSPSLLDRAQAFEPELIALRRHFHRHPELSFQEVQTSAECARRVEALGYDVKRNVGKTGVVAELRNGAGPTIALRADMDALPIQEENDVDYRSAVPGVMHACGHDTHMTMLIGAARLLQEARTRGELPGGTVRLLFQPSEESTDSENKSGAGRMIDEGALDGVDAVFGLHIGAHLKAGTFYVSSGPTMAGTDTFTATIRGKSAHAARPHEGVDAIVLAAHVIAACQTIVARRLNPFDEGVLTIGMVNGGTAENIIADRVTLRGTLRYFRDHVRKTIRRELEKACAIAETLGGKYQLDLRDGYPPVVNDKAKTEVARAAITNSIGSEHIAAVEPIMGAEDFALMLKQAPGAFLWLGGALGKPREHHHPEFNVDESVLVKGATAMAAIAMQALRTVTAGVLAAAMIFGSTGCGQQSARMGQTEGTDEKRPPDVTFAEHGMVASNEPIASDVGVRVLQAGGNAIDAAIATAFAMAVTYPEAGNIGGGGFIVARFADGRTAALDFREVAPGRASRDMYLDANGNVTNQSLIGHLASGVPGSVAGLWAAHQKFGTKPWRELLQPAIDLAQNGFIVDEHLSSAIGNDERLASFPASAALLLRDGKAPAPGTRLTNPDLTAVLRRIAERGRDGFYQGETADLIVAEMQRGGGLITHADLEHYQPKWREPIEFTYRGHRVISMAPASSGGITLALMANILEGYDLKALGPKSPERFHLIAEASKRAFADRNYYLGDPDFVKIPITKLLSQEYATQQRATISLDRATPSSEVRPGLGQLSEGVHTTHFSVVDADGNAVAYTTTLNELHGSAVTVAGAGFLLNDEMDDFTAKVGVPNLFGLVQGEANAIAPGKRMLSAMTPTIVLDTNGAPMLITGARGGPRIISAVFQVISNVLDHGMTLPEAVTAPRIHHQHLPDSLFHEKNAFDAATAAELKKKGHNLTERAGYVGNAPTILRIGNGWAGMTDPRSAGKAAGY